MKNQMLLLFVCLGLSIPMMGYGQIPDSQIGRTVEKYFARSRTAPTMISAEIEQDVMYGRTLKIRIAGHRNRENAELGFAFGAAAAVANRANQKFDYLWVEMDVRYKETETTIALAPADCSIDCIVLKTQEFSYWWENCIEFL